MVPFDGAMPDNWAGTEPAQMAWFAPIDPTARVGFTSMVRVFEVAGLPVVHNSLEVRMHVTASLAAGL